MSHPFVTVDAAAELLQLHPKTVLRFIRDGRLRATRVGRQYRILRTDLDAFAGAGATAPITRTARVTAIVDIEPVDPTLLGRLNTLLFASLQGRAPEEPEVALDIAHDPLRQSAKVVIVAAPTAAATLLELVTACLEN